MVKKVQTKILCAIPIFFVLCQGSPQFPCNIVAFGKQCVDAALAFRDVSADVELAVHPHVVNGIELSQLVLPYVMKGVGSRQTFMLYG